MEEEEKENEEKETELFPGMKVTSLSSAKAEVTAVTLGVFIHCLPTHHQERQAMIL